MNSKSPLCLSVLWIPVILPLLLQWQQHTCKSYDSLHHSIRHQLHKDVYTRPQYVTLWIEIFFLFCYSSQKLINRDLQDYMPRRCLTVLKANLEVSAVKNEVIYSQPTQAVLPLLAIRQRAASRTGLEQENPKLCHTRLANFQPNRSVLSNLYWDCLLQNEKSLVLVYFVEMYIYLCYFCIKDYWIGWLVLQLFCIRNLHQNRKKFHNFQPAINK